jgi:hypothetical protein
MGSWVIVFPMLWAKLANGEMAAGIEERLCKEGNICDVNVVGWDVQLRWRR